MRYGMPWQGSKSRIAEWVIDCLPASHTLVDLFAGGCAVTHAALLSGKFERIIANDLTDSVKVFFAAINGEFEGYSMCASREEFERYQEEDTALALLNSFGNDRTTYLWGEELEAIKRPASLMLSSPSIWERRQWYRKFVAALKGFLSGGSDKRWNELQFHGGLERLESLERLERLQSLENINNGSVILSNLSYEEVPIESDSVIYCDPPYINTGTYLDDFNHEKFYEWLRECRKKNQQVFISEYQMPNDFHEVFSIKKRVSFSRNQNIQKVEKLFVNMGYESVYTQMNLF